MPMRANPEILRRVWLEMNPARVICLALILPAVYVLAYLVADGYHEFLSVCRDISLIGIVVLPGIWGTRLVVEALTEEIRGRTWELQRMTPLSPWQMTLGKLIGGPIYAWYGGLLFIPPYLFSIWGLGDPARGIWHLINLLLAVALFHGMALAFALIGVRKARFWNAEMPRAMPFYLLLGFVSLLWMTGGSLHHFGRFRLVWYGLSAENPSFLTGSLLFFAFWAVVGAYRSMRRELQVGGVPWVWLVFLVTVMFYAAGMSIPQWEWSGTGRMAARLVSAGFIGVLAAYAAMFAEVKDPVEERRLFAAAEDGDWRTFGESLPLWPIPAVLVGGICVLLMATPIGAVFVTFPIVVYLFLLRDMGLILLAHRVVRPRRADAAAVIWLLLLYVLCPMLVGTATKSKIVVSFFLPFPAENAVLQLIAVFLQASAVAALLARRPAG
ncbi:MAG: hypothetical protein ACLFRG_21025 [Desulfococcaceae bacterium]